jgi:putative DNA primase/helicase
LHPAILAIVTDAAGNAVTIYRTYLSANGTNKAPGIETALSAARLFGVPTWPAISANGIENFEPPPEVRKRVIFGDTISTAAGSVLLTNSPGRLADRISVQVEISDEPGADWNARAISNCAR